MRNLITMVTPVDFHTPENLLTKWTEHVDLDALVQATGNVPGELLNALFLSLMPFRLTSQKYVDLLDQIDDPRRAREFPAHGEVDLRQPGSGGRDVPPVHVTGSCSENRLAARARSSWRPSRGPAAICRCRC